MKSKTNQSHQNNIFMKLSDVKFNGTVYGKKDNYYVFISGKKTIVSNEDVIEYELEKRNQILKSYQDNRKEKYTTLVGGVENTFVFEFENGKVCDIIVNNKSGGKLNAENYYAALTQLPEGSIISKEVILANGHVTN